MKKVACKELNKVCRRRQDKISNGCNTSEKVKHLYLSLGSTELFTSVVILMTDMLWVLKITVSMRGFF